MKKFSKNRILDISYKIFCLTAIAGVIAFGEPIKKKQDKNSLESSIKYESYNPIKGATKYLGKKFSAKKHDKKEVSDIGMDWDGDFEADGHFIFYDLNKKKGYLNYPDALAYYENEKIWPNKIKMRDKAKFVYFFRDGNPDNPGIFLLDSNNDERLEKIINEDNPSFVTFKN